jgi:nitrogen fixation/metabolism regulation signal transduction histidine kinase
MAEPESLTGVTATAAPPPAARAESPRRVAAAAGRGRRVQVSVEQSVFLLALLGGAPAIAMVLILLWWQPYSFEVRWTATVFVLGIWFACAAFAKQIVARVLLVAANLLGALREGDYSIRATRARNGTAADLVMAEINALGETLQRQRTEAVESMALLASVMHAIDVAVLAFDMSEQLVLVNPAGERLLGKPALQVLNRSARELGVADYITGNTPRLVERMVGAQRGRFELRRSTFRRDGRPQHLVVLADVSRALREEEQLAWQRIVRVLSHEINNSLTPIKSIAHSVKRIISRTEGVPRQQEVIDGLSLIETRSGALGRFLRAYAQLAKLPKPAPRELDLLPLVRRVAGLEDRLPVVVRATSQTPLNADPDQLEQLLINIIRNAVDAALETGGSVWIDWGREDDLLRLTVDDEGPGLPDSANLFVPFFTTKPAGSGIGLVLCRQIAEAHGGTLALERRDPERGARAVLKLPLPRG